MTAIWLTYLRTSSEAWEDYMQWLAAERLCALNTPCKDWDGYNRQQGAVKELDNLKHISTMDQKEEASKQAYIEASNGGRRETKP